MKINEKELITADFEKAAVILKTYLGSNTHFPGKKPQNERENSVVIDKINQIIITDEQKKSNMEEKIDTIIDVANSFSFKGKLLEDLEKEFL
jgi:hypothetical protein